jgi:hypothetical protein
MESPLARKSVDNASRYVVFGVAYPFTWQIDEPTVTAHCSALQHYTPRVITSRALGMAQHAVGSLSSHLLEVNL